MAVICSVVKGLQVVRYERIAGTVRRATCECSSLWEQRSTTIGRAVATYVASDPLAPKGGINHTCYTSHGGQPIGVERCAAGGCIACEPNTEGGSLEFERTDGQA